MDVRSLSNQVRAALFAMAQRIPPMPRRQVATLGPLTANTSTDVPITWGVPFDDSNYWVGITIITGGAGASALRAVLKAGTRTNTGVTITVTTTADVAIANIDVIGWDLT